MAYIFSGVFSDGDPQTMKHLLDLVSGAGRIIDHPFHGFGVQFGPDRIDQQLVQSFPLVPWSSRFPNITFVYLYVECFGGDCDHAGFAFREGQVLEDIPFTESDYPLRKLLKYLGVDLGQTPFFEPLQREYFEHEIER
jgi:hypothetical protein